METDSKIRFATSNDMIQIINLCGLHAAYEKTEYQVEGKLENLSNALFGTIPRLYCLIIESNDGLIGYATYMLQYATWDASEYIYMDCLFMKESSRGFGLGEKLVRRIQEEGRAMGIGLVQWQTPDFNVKAIKFYKRIGAEVKSKERFFLKI